MHWGDYRREILTTEFCDVLIVIYPLKNKQEYRYVTHISIVI